MGFWDYYYKTPGDELSRIGHSRCEMTVRVIRQPDIVYSGTQVPMPEKFPRFPLSGRRTSWEEILNRGHTPLQIIRTLLRRMPSDPRCRICLAPFAGPGGRMVSLIGFGPSRLNPNFCANCLEHLPPGGAEVEIAVMFADIRGSTAMGGGVNATTFAARMNAFYQAATGTLIARDALIDKLLGDEVLALFVPGFCGPRFEERAIEAAIALLDVTGRDRDLASWLSIGVAVHAGPAFVGNVGGEGVFDFTALGDTVNVGARLQGIAGPGELVVSERAYAAAPGIGPGERRSITVKGKSEPLSVRVLHPAQT